MVENLEMEEDGEEGRRQKAELGKWKSEEEPASPLPFRLRHSTQL